MFEREVHFPEAVADQFPENIAAQYENLPPAILDMHDRWSADAHAMAAEAPSLTHEQADVLRDTVSEARGISLLHLGMLPKAVIRVQGVQLESLKQKRHAAKQSQPLDFMRHTAVPDFETFHSDICASALQYQGVVDKEALRNEYNKVLQEAAGTISDRTQRLYIQGELVLGQLSSEQVNDIAIAITKRHSRFIETRLNTVKEAARVIPERSGAQRVFRAIGRVATFGIAYSQEVQDRKRLQTLLEKDLTAHNRAFGVHTEGLIQGWLIQNGYVLDEAGEKSHISSIYDDAASHVVGQLDSIKQRFISGSQPEQVTVVQTTVEERLKALSYASTDEFLLDVRKLAEKLGRKKAFRRLSRQLHPDTSDHPELAEPYLLALARWHTEQENPKNQG